MRDAVAISTTDGAKVRSPVALWIESPEWLARWGVAVVLFVVDAIWLMWRHDNAVLVTLNGVTIVTSLLAIASALAMLSFAISRAGRPLLALSDFLESLVYALVFTAFLGPFTSLVASLDLPLTDDVLKRADAALGFDWSTASDWVANRPMIDAVLRTAYFSLLWQAPAVLLIGSYLRPGERNAEAMWLYMISVLACVIISAALPALGEAGGIGEHHIDELRTIRSGNWALMSVSAGGIVTFPSFHAALAVIYIYAMRGWWASVFTPLNLVMLASTPTVGGHYLVDVIAGVAIACASIGLVRSVGGSRRRRVVGWSRSIG